MSNYELNEADLASPLINAAGSINGTSPENILREVDDLAATGIGAITVGSFTVPRQEGDVITYGEPVYYHDSQKGLTYNSMGLPNIGLDEAIKMADKITQHAEAMGKPIIFSVSPTLPSQEIGGPNEQAAELVYRFFDDAAAEFVEVNVSCPNVVAQDGSRKPLLGYDPEGMEKLMGDLKEKIGRPSGNLGLKMPPYLEKEQTDVMPKIADTILESGLFSFLTTSNTVPNQIPLNDGGEKILSVPNGAGGMSGPMTKDIGRDQLKRWKELLGDRLDIISMLGVDSGKELALRRSMGAVAAGGVTFLWESDNWKKAVTKILTDFADIEEN